MLAFAYLVNKVPDASGIIGPSVTLATLGLDADELAGSVGSILRMSLSKDFALSIKQHGRLVEPRNIALGETAGRVGASVGIALTPRCDSRRATSEDDSSTNDTDGSRDIVETDVVEDKGSRELAVGGYRVADEHLSIGHDGIDDGLGTSSLKARINNMKGDANQVHFTCVCWVFPPTARSKPIGQLLIVMPWKVQPEDLAH